MSVTANYHVMLEGPDEYIYVSGALYDLQRALKCARSSVVDTPAYKGSTAYVVDARNGAKIAQFGEGYEPFDI